MGGENDDFPTERQRGDAQKIKLLLILSLIATGLSIYLLYDHVQDEDHSFCDIGELVSCRKVRRSQYSELFGVPVAAFGILYNVIMVGLLTAVLTVQGDLNYTARLIYAIFHLQLTGIAFVFYLILAEIAIGAICPYCTFVHIIQVISLFLSWKVYGALRNKPSLVDALLGLKSWIVIAALLGLTTILFFNIPSSSPGLDINGFPTPTSTSMVEFAKCLSEKGWKMIGRTGCSWCEREKALFGESFSLIDFVDCVVVDCEAYKVTGYPTWVLNDPAGEEIKRWNGFATLENLSVLTECSL
eukprot:TRINITY_DN4266_c3_g1_i3.p1 TRINITY_DN4266_c3_g1~~TRINITY_DN4266_c3_g1_i3.p1  ORF type:complete len:300 (-),score=131.88 TRINITY_DN4266_c3_g1_i3:153-1052(-)